MAISQFSMTTPGEIHGSGYNLSDDDNSPIKLNEE